MNDPVPLARPTPLLGARICITGSVPEVESVTAEQRAAMLGFLQRLAKRVFQHGGHIVHGSHPSFTPTLLAAAKQAQAAGVRRDCLALIVSRHWSKDKTQA